MVVVGEVRAQRAANDLRHRVPDSGGKIAELLLGEPVHLGPQPGQVADAVDVPHLPLGSCHSLTEERPDHDAPLAVGCEELAFGHGEVGGREICEALRGSLDGRIETDPSELLEIRIVDDGLQRFPELVAAGLQEAEQFLLVGALVLGGVRQIELHAGGFGGFQPLPLVDGGAGLGERLGDALPQDVAGAGIEVVDGTHAARGLLALLRGGLGVENVEVAVRLDGPGRDLAERLVPRDGWREPRGGEQKGRDHRDRREARQREQSAKARAPEQALPEGRFGVGGHSAAGSLPPAAAVPPISLESPVGPTGRRFFQPASRPRRGPFSTTARYPDSAASSAARGRWRVAPGPRRPWACPRRRGSSPSSRGC